MSEIILVSVGLILEFLSFYNAIKYNLFRTKKSDLDKEVEFPIKDIKNKDIRCEAWKSLILLAGGMFFQWLALFFKS